MRGNERRGRYDRSLSRAERATRQRHAILEAGAAALDEVGGAALTVDDVLARTHVGRNTFYAHFDGVPDLMGGIREQARERLFEVVDAAIDGSRTPLERLRALADAWVRAVAGDPVLARACLSHVVGVDPRHLGSGATEDVASRLRDVLAGARRDGLLSKRPPPMAERAVAGAFVAVALSVVDPRRPVTIQEASSVLVDLTLRTLR